MYRLSRSCFVRYHVFGLEASMRETIATLTAYGLLIVLRTEVTVATHECTGAPMMLGD